MANRFDQRLALFREIFVDRGDNLSAIADSRRDALDRAGADVADGEHAATVGLERQLLASGAAGATGLYYDPLGRLWQVASSSSWNEFAYDGIAGSPVREYDGASGTALQATRSGR